MDAGLLNRVPPNDRDAEISVLGACMCDNEACIFALADLSSADFYNSSHARIFEAIVAIHDKNGRVDVVTLQAELKQKKMLDVVGGPAYLREVQDLVPSSANIEQYIEIVRGMAYRRNVLMTCTRTIENVFNSSMTVEELAATPNPLEESSPPTKEQSLARVLHEVLDDIDAGKRDECLPTGLPELNRMMDGGLYLGEATVLAARPSMGKSSLAAFIAYQVAMAGVEVLYVNLEMRNRYMAYRYISARSGLSLSHVRHARDPEAITAAAADIAEDIGGNIRFSSARTAAAIKATLGDAKLVVVDYLTKMKHPGGPTQKRNERVGQSMQNLHSLARHEGVHVIVVSQMNREAEQRRDKRPLLAELKESGELEEAADNVLLLYRPRYYDRSLGLDSEGFEPCDLNVAKQRNGPTGVLETLRVRLSRMDWRTA